MSEEVKAKIGVIIPAAGKGTRLGSDKPKAEVPLAGKPLFMHAVEAFIKRGDVTQIIIAVAPDQLNKFKFQYGDKLQLLGVDITAGGEKERWESIMKAGALLKDEITHVAVHDAARPLPASEMIDRVFEASEYYNCVIPGVPVSSTLKQCSKVEAAETELDIDPLDALLKGDTAKKQIDAWAVETTVPREDLFMIQTPQILERSLFDRAYKMVNDGKVPTEKITDDAGIAEAIGEAVHVVMGDEFNLKITHPGDLQFAEIVAQIRKGGSNAGIGDKRKFPTWAEFEED